MLNNNLENEIFHNALEAFKKNVALPIEIDTEATEIHLRHDVRADRLLRILIKNTELHFYAEVKANIHNVILAGAVLHMYKDIQLQYDMLLVTRYVTAQLADKLKENNIQFIDTAGNAYINQAQFYIFVKGNRLPEKLQPIPAKRAFKPTGLKIIYAFLCNPGLEKRPYREIARIANVALGTVGWVMRDLKEMEYVIDRAKRGKQLIERETLLNRWVTAYTEQLKPKLLLGRFRGAAQWWINTTLYNYKAQWGGEVAAAKLTHYLQPQDITLYIDPAYLTQLLLDNRLKKDPKGETQIFERFWKPTDNQLNEDTVHPLLVYADLLATGDQRNIEIAKMIYEQYIIRYLRED